MNIKVQISGIIIILVLIIFCYGKRTLKLNTERVFKKIMFMSLGGSILDVLSIIAITNRDEIPDILVEVVSKGYLLSLVGICALGLNYICIDVFKGMCFYK